MASFMIFTASVQNVLDRPSYYDGCVTLKQILRVNISILCAKWWYRFPTSNAGCTFFVVLIRMELKYLHKTR
jgi:hypothetical protein